LGSVSRDGVRAVDLERVQIGSLNHGFTSDSRSPRLSYQQGCIAFEIRNNRRGPSDHPES
jgi:hypothetical protein